MTKQEQIKEIKQVLIKTCKRCRPFEEDYMQSKYAEALYNYVKEQRTQAVKEFAEKLKQKARGLTLEGNKGAGFYIGNILLTNDIDELLKEYEK